MKVRLHNFGVAPYSCFFDDRERQAYELGHDAAVNRERPRSPFPQRRLAWCYGRGWATTMAALRRTSIRMLAPEKAAAPRKLCAWTLANDKRLRAAIDRDDPRVDKLELHFVSDDFALGRASPSASPSRPATLETTMQRKTKPSEPRAIVPTVAGKAFTPAPGSQRERDTMNAAQKAWATRRANGWVHPASGGAPRAAAIPAEPIKRASLAAVAAGATQGAKVKAPEIAVGVETKPKRGGVSRPRLAVRATPAPERKARAKAKPAPAKKSTARKAKAARR